MAFRFHTHQQGARDQQPPKHDRRARGVEQPAARQARTHKQQPWRAGAGSPGADVATHRSHRAFQLPSFPLWNLPLWMADDLLPVYLTDSTCVDRLHSQRQAARCPVNTAISSRATDGTQRKHNQRLRVGVADWEARLGVWCTQVGVTATIHRGLSFCAENPKSSCSTEQRMVQTR